METLKKMDNDALIKELERMNFLLQTPQFVESLFVDDGLEWQDKLKNEAVARFIQSATA